MLSGTLDPVTNTSTKDDGWTGRATTGLDWAYATGLEGSSNQERPRIGHNELPLITGGPFPET